LLAFAEIDSGAIALSEVGESGYLSGLNPEE